ncbi:MAG: hypothetical protein IT367_08730 [Candidatus Hydrogenedentes bacterium]|nr:hypothetical protein [Candidatus Hydrogenedentota bacterium]
MAKWLVPFAFLKWLVTGDRLENVNSSDVRGMSEPARLGFWRWLFSSEELPVPDTAPPEIAPIGLLQFIFSGEVLPSSLPTAAATNSSGSSATPEENGN